ncbi:hypothetical protein BO83DRAFT_303627 [Aspergillus eucalypticola CBS 122712]|uniref:DUF3500 domain-containing protein n=1 Tax=Aspergillus eucalypticola (strain CBS 122712 / IBT 29274) TaxID=1448314 RepID=A0A317WDD8_ASPEC|nr:uncharacterized protein BO83DRAFT_303627 [Aspergillus eucalypticola CBS 122712]PWY84383.1 hypothetical protein BO83DRAFT_303627 [Aspergillus eucalypticola CBS 122712]
MAQPAPTLELGSEARGFRKYVPHPGHPRVAGLDQPDVETYSNKIASCPEVVGVFDQWKAQLNEPFYGITTDGQRKEGLFGIDDEGAPVEKMVAAAKKIQTVLSEEELRLVSHEIDSNDWRKWSNPEVVIFKYGVRLHTLCPQKIHAILKLVEASLSEAGYGKVVAAMEVNHFLGELVNGALILNRHSYQFALYGVPSTTEPWGFSLTGHHMCLNIFIMGKQMTISPVFIGAEPNEIDAGPQTGLTVCVDEGTYALQLMQTLPDQLKQKAQIYSELYSEKMPPGRWNPYDQRHLGGAFQDNRIIPYEGIKAIDMPAAQQKILLKVIASFLVLLPPGPFDARMLQVKKALNETYFSWIGDFGDEDPFYYRIQSPVIMLEFDHHSGVFLLNTAPAKHHVHTIIRTPNGNDYGRELLKQFRGNMSV